MRTLTIPEEISILRDLTDKTKYELVGIGLGRAVYSSKTDDTVVKLVPYRSGGMLQNENEADITERGCPYVAKVLSKGIFMVVSEKVSTDGISDEERASTNDAFHSWCGNHGESDCLKQIGRLANGTAVVYDYGIPCGVSDRKPYDGMTFFFKAKTEEERNTHILNVIVTELKMLENDGTEL